MEELKRMIQELGAQMNESAESALNLAILTGDEDFAALSLIIPMLMKAVSRGEVMEMAAVLAKFAEAKTSKTPAMDLSREAIKNSINLN
jgi:hypothetical protein